MHAIEPIYQPMLLAGTPADADRVIEVRNPFSGALVGSVPQAEKRQIRAAFAAAARFRPKLSRRERSDILLGTARAIASNQDRLARLITAETGLCLKDSLHETRRACDVWSFAAHALIQNDGEIYPGDIGGNPHARRIFSMRTPLAGVIAAITPFNHPLNLVSHKLAPAIATNNRVVLKPSEQTPLTALALGRILREQGLPDGMLSIVTGTPHDLGDCVFTDEDAELVTFTGSVRVGHQIAERAGYRRLVLELGGNDPFIVLADADVDRAAQLAVQGAVRHSGQRCTAVKRALVVEELADRFAERALHHMQQLSTGDPSDPSVDLGTVISEDAAQLIARRVDGAVAAGARLLLGGEPRGAFCPPTLLDHVPPACELVAEETFGPVLPIIRCNNDIEEIVMTANATRFGLSAAICSNRLDHVTRLIEGLAVGSVNVWEVPGYRTELTPFGGIKQSGLGHKEGIVEAMRSFTQVKTYSLPWPV
ncbi:MULTISPECIES: phosphonoacetaldehyde dehydrogenase [Bradyrhizobium]|uniref:Phosphonoacetaldehyde dehydrogenase n=1 Tax=Bradyrhizobium aeschynomenes TaxID=2734909 RepID=A0ABX2CGB0_9BRAD|nr:MULTISPECIES: phosphonoacetaldehyde dehydrogenase [Bradyrhizobium]NPU13445.1 phosphonoacetaldehyde dehydrogenase [Bradyrhizobium aeschynomenes]NPU66312.1 phosphonoacetaldehyde dehydrogenase [Bradyrhizobium aeschynomenes]